MFTFIFAIVTTFSPVASNLEPPRCAGYTVAHLDSGRTVTMCSGRVVQVRDEIGNVRTFEVK